MEYQSLASFMAHCLLARDSRPDLKMHWTKRILLCEEHLPSGSGFDSGTRVCLTNSNPDRIVLETSFHHMDEHGGYDGWTEHEVIVKPSLAFGIDLRITGRNRNDIKDYLYEVFTHVLLSRTRWDMSGNQEVVTLITGGE